VGSVVALLYSSRACYNLVAVAISPDSVPGPFNYGWDNLSDKVSVCDPQSRANKVKGRYSAVL